MARIMDHVCNSNIGEERFIQAISEYLDDRYIVYRNRVNYGQELDICILIPDIGILVVEVKGWMESTVNEVLDGHRIRINTSNGIIEQTPRKQARGYRFALENKIRNEIGKYPLVFDMVCYPFISREFYLIKGMDRVSEVPFTFLKEDLENAHDMRAKLDKAIVLTQIWLRDPFIKRLMYQVRSLFEPNVSYEEENSEQQIEIVEKDNAERWLVPIYSKLCYISKQDDKDTDHIDELISLYEKGTKIYLITPHEKVIDYAAKQLSLLLTRKNLLWDKNHLSVMIGTDDNNMTGNSEGFRCFNFQASLITKYENMSSNDSFFLDDGKGIDDNEVDRVLTHFHNSSSFNYNQYKVEHAYPKKNILVRAGAGTGKTHVMISRILFLCYKDQIAPANLKKRIQMITFTNDAADNMKRRLKDCFQDYFLLTIEPSFLEMIGQVDSMKISTIHSYARKIIENVGSDMGFGHKVHISSAELSRREAVEEVLEGYLLEKHSEDNNYLDKLGLPIYELRKLINAFIDQLTNKSLDVRSLQAEQFGKPVGGENSTLFNELIKNVIPKAEQLYNANLLADSKIHLKTMMSLFSQSVQLGEKRLLEHKEHDPQYLFIDEFQDTDDVQIDTLMKIAQTINFRLFIVGDIKQCIYRFRGAEEKAFDRLSIEKQTELWNSFVLTKNYRTDQRLLEAYQQIFKYWGDKGLLNYDHDTDALNSSISYNLTNPTVDFFRCLPVASRDVMSEALFTEIGRCKEILCSLIASGKHLSTSEKTIAILVRENWQAEAIRRDGARFGYPNIRTHTGGDLYQSAPALDLLTLVLAILNNRNPEKLYALLTSNFFKQLLNRQILYDLRYRSEDRSKISDNQFSSLVQALDNAFRKLGDGSWSWHGMLERLRVEPVLQVLRQFYSLTCPWGRYSADIWSQQFYHINIDLVFEKIINSLNIDNLTISTLASYLQMCVVTGKSEDCRWPELENDEIFILCITVHKAKGLEYGWVLLPYGGFPIDKPKKNKLEITYVNNKIGYRFYPPERRDQVVNSNYDHHQEIQDRMREETRLLYVVMTRAIRSFSWVKLLQGASITSWQTLLEGGINDAH